MYPLHDDQEIWYRTEEQQSEHNQKGLYGKDAREWLERWDTGQSVWSIELGGLGPGYEQCIQITVAEILRWLLEHGKPTNDEQLERDVLEVPDVQRLGLSSAQWGAARGMAGALYDLGPRKIFTDEKYKDRMIQVGRHFPGSAAV